MTTHTVQMTITIEVTDELAVREHAFRLMRDRMSLDQGGGADRMSGELSDDVSKALRLLASWQITAGEGLKGAPGLKITRTEVPPERA